MPCALTFCLLGRHGRADTAPHALPDMVPALLLALAATSALFALAPSLDLWASGLFAAPGGGFPLSLDPALIALRDLNRALPGWIVAALLILLLARALTNGGPARRLPRPSVVALILATYLVAPLGIVQTLKTIIGRARPRDIVSFGGDHLFTAAWQMSDACARNCSFSSGEAASAAMLPLLALLAPRRWRVDVSVALCVPALVFSINRIAFGGHFLSDVLVSWLLVAVTAALVGRLAGRWASRLDAAVDGRLRAPAARYGRSLRSSFAPGALLRAPDGL